MKVSTAYDEVTRSGVNSETEFSIKTTAKAFDILSSGLYSNKILAVIREISCNAFDAHVDAGKRDVPIDVHLPTTLEPWFAVRDYGLGMSHEQIYDLYTNYFDSTKTQSNDFIGAMGLGSKSPFSYTKTFTVTAFQNRNARVYTMFVNERGIPSIAQTLDWCPLEYGGDGLEVKMTTANKDMRSFLQNAGEFFRYADVQPNYTGGVPTYTEPAVVLSGDGWQIQKCTRWTDRIIALQGNVPYAVDINQLDLPQRVVKGLRDIAVVFTVPIGTLEVAASREALQYDKRTVANISEALTSVVCGIISHAEELASKHPTSLWDRVVALSELSRNVFDRRDALPHIITDSETVTPLLKEYVEFNIFKFRSNISELPDLDTAIYVANINGSVKRKTENKSVFPSVNTVVVINDVKSGGVSRIKHWLINNEKATQAFVIKPTGSDDTSVDKQIVEILKRIGSPTTVLRASSFKAPPRETRVAEDYDLHTLYLSHTNNLTWIKTTVDFDEGGLYVPLEFCSKVIVNPNMSVKITEYYANSLSDITNALKSIDAIPDGVTNFAVYGASKQKLSSVVKHDKWFNLFDLVAENIDKLTDEIRSANAAKTAASTARNFNRWCRFQDKCFIDRYLQLPEHGTFRQLLDPVHKAISDMNKTMVAAAKSLSMFNLIPDIDNTTDPLCDFSIMHTKYPMLTLVSVYSVSNSDLDILFDYIRQIDNNNIHEDTKCQA